MTSTLTVTEFVSARLAEDEYEARVCLTQWENGEGGTSRRWRRQLAECAAMRKIVEVVAGWNHTTCEDSWYSCAATYGTDAEYACCDDGREGMGCDCGLEYRVAQILSPLASIWSDHPEFNPDWS